MDIPLRLLIIEDSDRDVALEMRALEAAGYRVTYTVVVTAAEMKAALAEQTFDIVISDHAMPQFDAPGALAVLKESGLDIPFIIVSGSIGEEAAVALMKAGAHDYVLKHRLSFLAPGVEHALQDAEDRHGRKRAEEALRESEEKYRNLFDNAGEAIFVAQEGKIVFLNPRMSCLIGYPAEEIMGRQFIKFIHPDEREMVIDRHFKRLKGEALPQRYEFRVIQKNGTTMWVELNTVVIRWEGKPSTLNFLEDITERKLSEEKLLKSYESLKKTLNDAIDTMVKIVETRDPYTAGHQQRVAELATAIAREMKLEDTRIDQLRMAAVIHDIGKMYVPSDILSKPGELLDVEFSLIKAHPQYGYDIVKGMDFPCSVAQAVLQHHERLDGSGYPQSLKGEDIILEAKILAVADVIEAMSSHRPYRPALGIDKALEEISKNKGNLYDPDVVDACLELYKSGRFEFKPV
ncbi:MAG: HD domain-containing phosphohydrolase [Dehalococcoidia bacterium]|jgi:PAS domain S-box-containing protein/putative nucleotidyltransferase with HDIG domain